MKKSDVISGFQEGLSYLVNIDKFNAKQQCESTGGKNQIFKKYPYLLITIINKIS